MSEPKYFATHYCASIVLGCKRFCQIIGRHVGVIDLVQPDFVYLDQLYHKVGLDVYMPVPRKMLSMDFFSPLPCAGIVLIDERCALFGP